MRWFDYEEPDYDDSIRERYWQELDDIENEARMDFEMAPSCVKLARFVGAAVLWAAQRFVWDMQWPVVEDDIPF